VIAGAAGLIILIGPKETIGKLFFRGRPEVSSVVGFAIFVAAFGLFTSILLEAITALPTALQRFGICNAVNVVGGVVRSVGPVIVLACGYSIRAVLLVSLASNMLAVVAFAVISRRLIPGLSLWPKFSPPAFRKLFSFSLPLLLTAILLMLPRPILRYWLGPEYAAQGAVALTLLGLATFMNAASAIATVSSLGVGQAWLPAASAFVASAISLAANLVLIPRYGINGAAMAALVPQVVVVPVFVYVVTKMLKFSLWELISHGFLRPLLCAGIQAGILFLFRSSVNSLFSLALLCLLSLCVFGVLSLFGAITREERKALFGIPFFAANKQRTVLSGSSTAD